MQYICSEKPMRCPDKVTALHSLTHRVDFANAPHCVFSFTAHRSPFNNGTQMTLMRQIFEL